LANKGEF